MKPKTKPRPFPHTHNKISSLPPYIRERDTERHCTLHIAELDTSPTPQKQQPQQQLRNSTNCSSQINNPTLAPSTPPFSSSSQSSITLEKKKTPTYPNAITLSHSTRVYSHPREKEKKRKAWINVFLASNLPLPCWVLSKSSILWKCSQLDAIRVDSQRWAWTAWNSYQAGEPPETFSRARPQGLLQEEDGLGNARPEEEGNWVVRRRQLLRNADVFGCLCPDWPVLCSVTSRDAGAEILACCRHWERPDVDELPVPVPELYESGRTPEEGLPCWTLVFLLAGQMLVGGVSEAAVLSDGMSGAGESVRLWL